MIDIMKQGFGQARPNKNTSAPFFHYSLPMNLFQVSSSVLYSVHFFILFFIITPFHSSSELF